MDKFIRQYYGDEGVMLVFRTDDGIEYHISRKRYIENLYSKKNNEES